MAKKDTDGEAVSQPDSDQAESPPTAAPASPEPAADAPQPDEPDNSLNADGTDATTPPRARVSLTTVSMAVQHRQRATGIVELQQALAEQGGAKDLAATGDVDDATLEAIAAARKKHKLGEGGVDAQLLEKLGLDVTD